MEPARIVEAMEVWLEVHVHPLDPLLPGYIYRQLYQPTTDPPTTKNGVHRGIQDEGVDTPDPSQVDEADKLASPESADVAQAVLQDRLEVILSMPRPRRLEQVVQLAVRHGNVH